jgi:2-polyprenyl-6-methoxyphenol hydroxylase-like FAD-dependent oxidoreductase
MSAPTPEELAAILAAVAASRRVEESLSPYEAWRRARRAALRRRS